MDNSYELLEFTIKGGNMVMPIEDFRIKFIGILLDNIINSLFTTMENHKEVFGKELFRGFVHGTCKGSSQKPDGN